MTSTTVSSTALPIDNDAGEHALRSRFACWLEDICEDSVRHSRFVNTLSLLEHIGSVKIARTQAGERITERILEHLAEETRHAQALKRISRRIAGGDIGDYRDALLVAGPESRRYFARLEALAHGFSRRELPVELRGAATYAIVTWLVERRAMWLYPAYQSILDDRGARISVRSIIGEETKHLAEIHESLKTLGLADHPGLEKLAARESELFGALAQAMFAATGSAS